MVKKFLILITLCLTSFFVTDKIYALDVTTDEPLLSYTFGDRWGKLFYDNENNQLVVYQHRYNYEDNRTSYFSLDNYEYFACGHDQSVNAIIHCVASSRDDIKYRIDNPQNVNVIAPINIGGFSFSYNDLGLTNVKNLSYSSNTNDVYPSSFRPSFTSVPYVSNFDIYNINNQLILSKNYSIELEPDFEFTYTPNTLNDYITSVNLLTSLNFVDDENYNYFYKFGEVVDWRQLYSENFINNTFSQLIKRNGIFYFKITDKENNVVVAKTFSINNINTPTKPSIEYDPSYNTEYDTITSVNLLTYFYIYDDQNYVCQQKFVDTSQTFNDVDFTTYNCDGGTFDNITSNGSVYSRILLNNNIVYSSTYTIYNIGTLSPDSDLNFFGRIGKSLNYGGPISNMITTPVQILNTIYTAVQFQACEPVSLGSLFGHELTLPCIDVESILGHNLYMFIDLVCAFYVAINIIGFILDTYNKLMDLHPDSLDSQKGRGGIFK